MEAAHPFYSCPPIASTGRILSSTRVGTIMPAAASTAVAPAIARQPRPDTAYHGESLSARDTRISGNADSNVPIPTPATITMTVSRRIMPTT